MLQEFTLPNLGENIESGQVVEIFVSEGDRIDKKQAVFELETDKAVIEVPSSMAGVVRTVHVKEGEQAAVGQLVLSIETLDKISDRSTDKVKEATAEPAPTTAREPIESAPPASSKVSTGEVVDFEQHTAQSEPAAATIAASPAVRRLAREMGVDIVQVKGSGPRGRISAGDVREHAQRRLGKDQQPMQMPSLPDFSRWGKVERQKFSNVRRATARQMRRSWSAIPHVTQHDCADITNFETGRRHYADLVEAEGIKLTVTVVALRVLASALRRFPQFNASLDVDRQETILKHYVNLGVAVDTPSGLLVPVIRDADHKNISELAREVHRLAGRARERKLSPEEMQGGTFTLTNLGGIGGTSFTPIINWPEVAVLGLSRAAPQPRLEAGQWVSRLMLPLSLSYDHRLIDGADAARFLRWIAGALEAPFLLALEG